MTGLNNGNTPKSPPSWLKDGRIEGWWDKYLPNPAGDKPSGERGKGGKMVINGGDRQQGEGFRKLEKESLGKNKREKDKLERFFKSFNLWIPLMYLGNIVSTYIKVWFGSLWPLVCCLNLPLWIFSHISEISCAYHILSPLSLC